MFRRLLAKSIPDVLEGELPPDSPALLQTHLQDVCSAVEAVLEATGEVQLAALGLPVERYVDRFYRVVRTAALLHDLGKANDHFQEMIRFKRKFQAIRHEWLTYYMVSDLDGPMLSNWLFDDFDPIDRLAVTSAITGHHPSFNRPSPPTSSAEGAGGEVTLFLGHDDFIASLNFIAELLHLGPPPRLSTRTISCIGDADIIAMLRRLHRKDRRIWDDLIPDDQRFIAGVKACLIAGDVAGSALAREMKTKDRHRWVVRGFSAVPSADDLSDIISDRLGSGNSLRDFQEDVAQQAGPVTLVRAGCGTGKTLAAYHWARSNHPNRRLYVCYPTTGTATEGFRDYLVSGESPRFDARLFHSRAEVDLEMLGVRPDAEIEDERLRVQSLESWSTPIVVCTVDVVLGLTQNFRRGLYAWPALAGAAFVFDEIHAYDAKLFGSLLSFLEALPGVPVLLMTASLPAHRDEALRDCLMVRGTRLVSISGPIEIETLPRYRRCESIGRSRLRSRIQKELSVGGKVLWVCNTVDRAIQTYDETRDLGSTLYHSRFRYEDRVARHAEVIDGFRRPGPAFSICTQVAEMSLDLSATLLVTELAPIPALIQRFGRLNRRAKQGDPAQPFIVIEPMGRDGGLNALPYEPDELVRARAWLDALPGETITQRDLVATWEEFTEDSTVEHSVTSTWLDGGPTTRVGDLRDISRGISVLLASDLPQVQKVPAQLPRFVLPMPTPIDRDWQTWSRFRGIPVAPNEAVDYHMLRGAQWQKPIPE